MTSSSSPTVLVKKSDGTFVRMTLAELEAYKKMKNTATASGRGPAQGGKNTPASQFVARPTLGSGNQAAESSAGRENTKTHKILPPLVGEVEEGFKAEESTSHLTRTPLTSPLPGGRVHESTKNTKNTENKKTHETHKHTNTPTHKHPAAHHPAASHPHRTLLHRLSHREQKKEQATALGGVPPTGGRARSKEQGTIEPRHLRPATPAPVKPAKPAWDKDDHQSLLEDVSEVSNTHALTTTTPVTKIFQDEAAVQARSKEQGARSNNFSGATAKPFSPPPVRPIVRPANEPKPILHDIRPPSPLEKMSMSPVDELRSLTLADWRRMGPSVNQIASRLLSRFTTLQSESYPTYIEAAAAWKTSPLYQAYLALIVASLAAARSLPETIIAGGKGAMTKEEFMALVGINRELM